MKNIAFKIAVLSIASLCSSLNLHAYCSRCNAGYYDDSREGYEGDEDAYYYNNDGYYYGYYRSENANRGNYYAQDRDNRPGYYVSSGYYQDNPNQQGVSRQDYYQTEAESYGSPNDSSYNPKGRFQAYQSEGQYNTSPNESYNQQGRYESYQSESQSNTAPSGSYNPQGRFQSYQNRDQYNRSEMGSDSSVTENFTDKSLKGTDDKAIAQQIQDNLKNDRSLSDDARRIQVSVNAGKVSLYGTVKNSSEKERVGLIAKQTNGVVSVYNNLNTSSR